MDFRPRYWRYGLLVGTAFIAGAVAGPRLGGLHEALAQDSSRTDMYQLLKVFGDVLQRVRAEYVDPVDDKDLIENAINGMLTGLDPHSSYMNAKAFKDMQIQTKGEFGGLGIEVNEDKGLIKVVSPIDDTPASKAGLMANDLITHLDNEAISGLTLEQAVEKMRGPVNTPITLTIVRKGKDEPFDVKVTRDVIRINPVKAHAEGDVGYVKITTFNEQTHANLVKAVDTIDKQLGPNIKGYIIDLRNNPGGLLDQAIAVSDDFLEQGAIVLTKGRNNEETQRANARPGDIADGKKMVVLINGGSASASEIVAGALQDHKRATVIGTRSFGKGSVQTIIPLGANGAIRLTTARYFTPSNRSIQAKGIDPDIAVDEVVPDDLKEKVASEKPRGEASLRGHLKNPDGSDQTKDDDLGEPSGSPSYVEKDEAKDTQLQYAINFLDGKAKGPETSSATPSPSDTPAAKPSTDDGKKAPPTAPSSDDDKKVTPN
jgi:carboxyl-terminal processing protease